MFGKFHSKETKLKMSKIKKGRFQSKETKLKISLTNSNKVFIYNNEAGLNKIFYLNLLITIQKQLNI